MNHSNEGARIESGALLGTALTFVVFFTLAARAYAGGTHFDHAAVGHDFWRNTLCDVARTVAINDQPNGCACWLARVAMVTLAVGIGVLFVALPRLFPSLPRLGRLVRVLGIATVACAIAVVLLPPDRFGRLHGLAIVLAGTLGLATVILALKGLFSDARAPRYVASLGVTTMSVAAVDFVLYATELASQGPAQLAVSVLERLATILLLVWMVAVCAACRGLRGRLCSDLHAIRR